MKYSLRKSWNSRRHRKEIPEDPTIETNACSNSNSNLVKPVKSKSFRHRSRRRSSSSSSSDLQSADRIKSKVFEPRYDAHSSDDDDDDHTFSPSTKTRTRPFDRLTHQIRQSFRNTLTRQRSRLESTTSNKLLLSNENHKLVPVLPPAISIGLTSPLPTSIEDEQEKRRKAPLVPTKMNQSISLPLEINPSQQEHQNFNRSFRTRFSFLRKKPSTHQVDENPNPKLTFTQRFNSIRRSFHIGNGNSSIKGKRHLLSNE